MMPLAWTDRDDARWLYRPESRFRLRYGNGLPAAKWYLRSM